ncbi:sulfotransferase [Flammeovirga sp. EKP202]|uniref:sulfotransferase family protein n=1 Tax=Flammeovirga sp. EKP202 TaxID=2770592 RepID=UPI00165FD8F9|nr:sulfotransferase [Flammeovirga sp. EKP202]MBD0404487.1 sulfotransferase [Flammeovirga sp. EKP202]
MIFIIGNSRSGTTMLGRILNNSEKVFTFKEIHFFEQLWEDQDTDNPISKDEAIELFSKLLNIQRIGYLAKNKTDINLSEAKIFYSKDSRDKFYKHNVFQDFLIYETTLKNKIIPCEQTPRNVLFIKEISKLFPQAKFINITRDPRNVLISQKKKWKRRFLGANNIPLKEAVRSFINYHPFTISKLWNKSIDSYYENQNNASLISVSFEDLVTDPKKNLKKICEFINIPFNENLLNVEQIGSSHGNDSKNIGIDSTKALSSYGGLNNSEIYICEKVTNKNLVKLGYQFSNEKPNPFTMLYYFVSFPVKTFFAVLLNLSRMKNIVNSISRRL